MASSSKDASANIAPSSVEDATANIATGDELSLVPDVPAHITSSYTEDAAAKPAMEVNIALLFEKWRLCRRLRVASTEGASANIDKEAKLSLGIEQVMLDAPEFSASSSEEDDSANNATEAELSLDSDKMASDSSELIASSSEEDASANYDLDAAISQIFEKVKSDAAERNAKSTTEISTKMMADASEHNAPSATEDAPANIVTEEEISQAFAEYKKRMSDTSPNIASSSKEDASANIATDASKNILSSSADASAIIASSSTKDASANIASSFTKDASENIASSADASDDNASSSADTAAAGTPPTLIILKSVEGETLEVDEAVAFKSETIKKLIESNSADISLNVTTCILIQVIKYCKRHVEAAAMASGDTEKELKEFDGDFVKVSLGTMFQIIMAADYLGIPSLMDLTCQYMADYIKDRSVEEVRDIFNIKSGFNEEDDDRIRIETEWACV